MQICLQNWFSFLYGGRSFSLIRSLLYSMRICFFYYICTFNHHQFICYDTNTLNAVCDLTDASLETANAQLFHNQGCEDCSSSVVWDEPS